MKSYKKGFTLIELLVVIAIIGILASVVLASLNTARAKGADAAIKANLANMRAQAELGYDTSSCYNAADGTADCTFTAVTGSCTTGTEDVFSNTTISSAISAAETASGTTGTCYQAANGGAWAAAVALKQQNVVNATSTTDYWCVDSTGASKAIDLNIATTNC